MNWLTKLERKYGRICIPNLISILVGAQVLVYAVELFVNQYVSLYLSLSRTALLMGQVWRAITFVFVPFSGGGPLSVIHRERAGKRVGRLPLQPVSPAGHGGRSGGLPADGLCRYLLPVALAPAGLCDAVSGGAGAPLLRHPHPGQVLRLVCGGAVGAQLSGVRHDGKTERSALYAELRRLLRPSVRAWVRREQWKRKNRR